MTLIECIRHEKSNWSQIRYRSFLIRKLWQGNINRAWSTAAKYSFRLIRLSDEVLRIVIIITKRSTSSYTTLNEHCDVTSRFIYPTSGSNSSLSSIRDNHHFQRIDFTMRFHKPERLSKKEYSYVYSYGRRGGRLTASPLRPLFEGYIYTSKASKLCNRQSMSSKFVYLFHLPRGVRNIVQGLYEK